MKTALGRFFVALHSLRQVILIIIYWVLPVGWPATGRERRGKRLVFRI
nr:MAG TPA_asm: hypothetical protein [Caudoviricetes sp.]